MLKQIAAVVAMDLGSLNHRILSSLVTIVGVATTVAVMISVLAIGTGLMQTANRTGSPTQVVVFTAGTTADYQGSISREAAAVIAQAPGIKQDQAGKPLVQPMAIVVVEVEKLEDGTSVSTGFVGTDTQGLKMNSDLKIINGRMFRPAVRELIVGKANRGRYRNLAVGDRIRLRGSEWSVVGEFSDAGGISENGLMADAETVMSAFDRPAFQRVQADLQSPEDFQRFKDALTSDPKLSVEVKLMKDYINDQLSQLTNVTNFVAYFVGVVMAIGAVFGAINTMYSAVDGRAREIATLRAIGFGGLPVVISVILESVVLAVPGALLGALIAWLLFNGNTTQIASLSFPLAVTPQLAILGVIWSVAIGLIGGVAPAVRAARLPVATALRAT